eukprot:5835483-Prymnesium_polylepis.1
MHERWMGGPREGRGRRDVPPVRPVDPHAKVRDVVVGLPLHLLEGRVLRREDERAIDVVRLPHVALLTEEAHVAVRQPRAARVVRASQQPVAQRALRAHGRGQEGRRVARGEAAHEGGLQRA